MSELGTLSLSVRIEASPEEVFPYLTDASLITSWIGTQADLKPEPGGRFSLDIGETLVRGRFVLVEPPYHVIFTWGVPGDAELPEGSTTVDIRLVADGSDTIVELTHLGLPASQLDGHRSGWIEHLDLLDAKASRTRP